MCRMRLMFAGIRIDSVAKRLGVEELWGYNLGL